jgi:hypothetical protein
VPRQRLAQLLHLRVGRHQSQGSAKVAQPGALQCPTPALAALAAAADAIRAPNFCSQNGYLSSRGGYQNRWHSLVSCQHGDSTSSRFDSPSGGPLSTCSSRASSSATRALVRHGSAPPGQSRSASAAAAAAAARWGPRPRRRRRRGVSAEPAAAAATAAACSSSRSDRLMSWAERATIRELGCRC